MRFRLRNAMAYLPFSYYYLGPVAFASYMLAGRSLFRRYKFSGYFFTACFVYFFTALLVNNGIANGLYLIRFFWGFLLFYVAFRSGVQLRIEGLLLFLSAITLLEAVAINTVISPQSMPNFPHDVDAAYTHFTAEGYYQRPNSFGGNASVTSVILVAMLSISNLNKFGKFLVLGAVTACMSGSGFLALTIYFLAALRPLVAGVLFLLMLTSIAYGEIVFKLSGEYLSFLLEYKIGQITAQFSPSSALLGTMPEGSKEFVGGDFALLSFVVTNGVVGSFLFLLVVMLNTTKRNCLAILIMLLGSLHYGIVFALPGQLVLGYLLGLKSDSIAVDNRGPLVRRSKTLPTGPELL